MTGADELDGSPPCAPQPIAARVTAPGETVSMRVVVNFGQVCAHGEIFVGPMSPTRPQWSGLSEEDIGLGIGPGVVSGVAGS
jgi:hypothetical protein